jgi:hypothetical protein
MKKTILLLFLFGCITVFCQNNQPVYILFNQGVTAICQYPVTKVPVKKIKLNYTQKRHRKVNVTRFILCRNIFVFELMKNKFETVEAAAVVSQYKIVTIEEILAREEEMEFKQNINELFPKIYLLESIENGQYAKYEVVWEKVQ